MMLCIINLIPVHFITQVGGNQKHINSFKLLYSIYFHCTICEIIIDRQIVRYNLYRWIDSQIERYTDGQIENCYIQYTFHCTICKIIIDRQIVRQYRQKDIQMVRQKIAIFNTLFIVRQKGIQMDRQLDRNYTDGQIVRQKDIQMDRQKIAIFNTH